MKKADIKPGVVYAYRRGSCGSPDPMVFLSTDLYTRARLGLAARKGDIDLGLAEIQRASEGAPWCQPAREGAKPKRGDWDSPDTGYPVATLSYYQPGCRASVIAEMRNLGPDAIGGKGRHEGLRFYVLTNLAGVLGPYEEVMAAYERDQQQAEQQDAEQRQVREAEAAMAERAVAALRERKIFATRDPGNFVRLTPHNAETLADLLEVLDR